MSTTETTDDEPSSEQQYEHIVLVAEKPALLDGEEHRERVESVLEEAGDQADLPLAGTAFGDDRVHAYVSNPNRYDSAQLLNQLKAESETAYRYRHDYQDGHLRWLRGSHAGTVAEADLS